MGSKTDKCILDMFDLGSRQKGVFWMFVVGSWTEQGILDMFDLGSGREDVFWILPKRGCSFWQIWVGWLDVENDGIISVEAVAHGDGAQRLFNFTRYL